ncbi:hybrid sensor histidine kinase/response regulator [Chitinimonas koreensis]|uniref:hybrid sensor histidine kinase/response regulator n=1 Tax=Chitinimonas koreensis TaxID=356302 RepID=UPI00165483DD|nr:hybrid sensor histidine kinase/response regulator [Chitinimonas koreensis]QNM98763.1 hybrid sensor histidine kinase/response regulator [Chitinimonas koreensis]
MAPPGSKQPLALTGNQVVGLDAPLDEDLRQSSVLIVDDSPNSIEVIAETLKHDYVIKVAIKGQKALDIAFATPPDIVLLDIMMPDMDGFEVCRQLKANPRTADVPVLFLSSRDQSDDVVRGMDFGAVDYVIKPAEPAILKARLRTHLRLARMMRGLRQQNELLSEAARLREDVERITRHDLKSPLGTILQASERMRTDPAQPDDQRELAQLVQGAVKEALGMVNLSMDLYRMEVGTYRPQLETVALDQLLMQVAREQMDRHAARRVTIGLPELALDARVERQLCHTLFSNLVANAVEASPTGGKVAISLRSAAQNCVVAIENRGVIPAAIRPRFLGKYVSHGKPDGSGLGAYSSKLMAEAMGGRIGFDCDDAADLTRLTVTLPAA